MTPAERLQLTIELCASAWPALCEGAPEIVERRFQRLREQNDLRNRRMTEGFLRAERYLANHPDDPSGSVD